MFYGSGYYERSDPLKRRKLYEKIMNKKAIKNYLNSKQRYPKPDINYVIDVARVLKRTLPPHMEDSNRFVN